MFFNHNIPYSMVQLLITKITSKIFIILYRNYPAEPNAIIYQSIILRFHFSYHHSVRVLEYIK